MHKLPYCLVLFGCVTMMGAQAQTTEVPPAWKWRDASGQINVSDLPPPTTVPAKDILERPPVRKMVTAVAPAVTVPAAPTLHALSTPRTDPELEMRRKRIQEEQAAQQRQQLAQLESARAEHCSRARGAIALLSDGLRVTRANAQGEREVLDDKMRDAELQRIRSIVAADCR